MHRLARLASAFQRIKYVRLSFHVEPQVSTATSGGYVIGFIRDATDLIPDGESGLSILTSTQGSLTKKWWESAVLNCGGFKDLFYTTNSPTEERWSSPGILVLFADGKATQAGSLTIYVDYEIELFEPSLEVTANKVGAVTTIKEDTEIDGGGTKLVTVFTKAASAGSIISGKPNVGDVYKLTSPRFYCINTSGTLTGLNSFLYVKVKEDGTLTPAYLDKTGKAVEEPEASYGKTAVLFKNEEVILHTSLITSGEVKGSSLLCHRTPSNNLEVGTNGFVVI